MPLFSFFLPARWNVSAMTGAQAATLDHESTAQAEGQ